MCSFTNTRLRKLLRFAHIINPVKVRESSDLYHAQPITFASMLEAKKQANSICKVSLYTTQYEEDKDVIPAGFEILNNLQQSVLDINPELKGKKLPLIADILKMLEHNTTAKYLIYTNADIGLMPYFYEYVANQIQKGHDAIVINRRRLLSHHKKVEDLPLIYADLGASHPGFDCFIFTRELLQKFILAEICVGVPFIGVTLVHNIFSFADNALFVPNQHLTFHLGVNVLASRSNAFYKHNRSEFFTKVQPVLKPYFKIEKFPYAALPFPKRALKWMLNPSLFTKNYLELEGKSFVQKCKTKLDEIRWRLLQK